MITNVHYPIPEFAKRLKITSGALMLLITNEDKVIEMSAEVHLYDSEENPERARSGPKMERRLEKLIRIFVNAAHGDCYIVFSAIHY